MTNETIARRLSAEFVGTALLVAAVVGSGIMGERLAGGSVAMALLANTVATGAALFALIMMFAGVSGAHFNPIVSLSSLISRDTGWRIVTGYVGAQITGGMVGVMLANLMFDLSPIAFSNKARSGPSQWLGEVVASFCLVGVVIAVSRRHEIFTVALAVAAIITAGYWFTSSTSFANPAVTIARAFTDTFAGIRQSDAPPFVVAQVVGAVFATFFFNWLVPRNYER